MKTHPFIIQASHKQSAVQRWTGRLLTLLFWGLWSWLWWPYLSRMLPASVLDFLAASGLPPASATSATGLLLFHTGALFVACAALVLWAVVHTRRYGNGERRQQASLVTVTELSSQLGLAPMVLQRGRLLQRMVAHHHDSGGLKQVDNADDHKRVAEVWHIWHQQPAAAAGRSGQTKEALAEPA